MHACKKKLRYLKLDKVQEFNFVHAQNILIRDKYKDFEIFDKDKYRFDKVKGELIKQPKKKKKPKDSEDK